ncbi:hypothetical protein BM1_09742 [Bipolaris maydis]|uniref:uncharacterized protein n=1 Tax=Cochliobolus heterostrophus TaxID=5016 RepID=UPI0024DBFF5C|nr:hypothetical protein BM1_09742 [Bipolaris maydis]KAJ5040663.1 hypothetical protein J3E74DRAFT_258063 [Bipolaris maydis]KAJ5061599.1 hypothetical protein J3E74DRAFT_473348 [Bipolaris maydis]KAJ6275739.1 hypothetical protein PSV08DRAFT_376110 [Bipolaris maydis]
MSACSRTVRAVSRSRVPPLKTLLPFLYQTTTIQQCQSTTRPIVRRTIASRSRPENGDDIPFVDENLPPPVDNEPGRKTTITSTERAAFEKLYRKFNTEGRQQKEKDHVVELDQIADEYYEDDEENSKPSLDQIFDEAMKGESRLRSIRTLAQRQRAGAQSGKDGSPTNQTGKELDNSPRSRRKGLGFDTAQLREMRLAERERVDKLIRNASTDRELWQILEREVFAKVRALDLDNTNVGDSRAPASESNSRAGTKGTTRPRTVTKPDPPSPEQRILFQNYPHHLITAVATLRSEFPSSLLPLSILPTIKSLGRSSHVLGATTTLYKHLIRTAWIQQSSFTTIDTLLTEMDNTAIEFDADILALLDAILKESNQARSGIFGRELQSVYSMELFVDEMSKIVKWRRTVAERLGLKSEDARLNDRIVRKIPQQGGSARVAKSYESWKGSQMEKQDDAIGAVEGDSAMDDGGKDNGVSTEAAETSSTAVDQTNGAVPATGGDATASVDGEEKSAVAAEEPVEQNRPSQNDDTPSEPTKIIL